MRQLPLFNILVMYLANLGKGIKYFDVCIKYFEFVKEELLNNVLGTYMESQK